MTSLSWPTHPLTPAEWEALPESDEFRLEVAEGMLVMAAKPHGRHQVATGRLFAAMDVALPREQYWIVDLGPTTVLTAYLLVDGAYELVGEFRDEAGLTVAGSSVTLDLTALTAR